MADLNVMAANIKNILSTVPEIVEAFDYEPQNINQLPAATLFFNGFTQTDQTTRRFSVNWNWVIRLYIPIRVSDIKVPQVQIRSLIESTIKQLRIDPTLGNACLYHTVTAGEVFAMLDQNNPMLIAELELSANTEE